MSFSSSTPKKRRLKAESPSSTDSSATKRPRVKMVLTWNDETYPDLTLNIRPGQNFRLAMDAACKKTKTDPANWRFLLDGDRLEAKSKVDEMEKHEDGVVKVEVFVNMDGGGY